MIDALLARFERIKNDPERIVDYLRMPRDLTIASPWVNRLGLQAARAAKDRALIKMRPRSYRGRFPEALDALDRDGFVRIENFLPADDFARLEAELAAMEELDKSRFYTVPFGENYESKFLFASKSPKAFPAFTEVLGDNPDIYDLAVGLSRRRRSYRPHVIVQWVYKPNSSAPSVDHEYNAFLHVDRHYAHLKAFFMLRDVNADTAPYSYVPGSHLWSWDRLWFEYRLGIEQTRARRHTTEQSYYSKEQRTLDVAMLHLAEELVRKQRLKVVPMVAPKNTLILSNNQGLHRRAPMKGDRPRVTANLDYKFLESIAQPLYPVLRHVAGLKHLTNRHAD